MIFLDARLRELYQKIEKICNRIGRHSEDITLLVATKYADVAEINRCIDAGVRVIGENRIQDAQRKIPQLLPVKKHFIGNLQSNKVKVAVQLFDLIEAVDSLVLAEKIDLEARKIGKIMPVLLEVNVGRDPRKRGISPEETFSFVKKLHTFDFLELKGFMTIVPYSENAQDSRIFFRILKELLEQCRKDFPEMDILSMGMSHDFEIAIEEWATEIRVGRYLFEEVGNDTIQTG